MSIAIAAGRLAQPTPEPPDKLFRLVVALFLSTLLIVCGAIIAPLI